MGWILALGLMISALIDLYAAPRLSTRMVDARSAGWLQLAGASLCGVTFAAVFLGFWVPVELRFAYAMAAGLAFRCAYAIYDIPQNALMSLGTTDDGSRNRVAGTRIWFSGTAILLIAVAITPLISERGEAGASLYLGLAFSVSVVAVLSSGGLAVYLGRQGAVARPVVPKSGGRTPRWSGEYALLMVLMAITSLASPLFSKVEPYFVVFVLEAPALGGLIMASMAIGIVIGQPVWTFVSIRSSRNRVLVSSAVLEMIGLALIAIPGAPPWFLLFAAFSFGLGNGGIGMVLWAGFSEVASRDAPGREGIAFAQFSALAKVCLAAGGFLIGLALASQDYRGGETDALVALMAGVPALGALGCLGVAWFWGRLARRRISSSAPRLS